MKVFNFGFKLSLAIATALPRLVLSDIVLSFFNGYSIAVLTRDAKVQGSGTRTQHEMYQQVVARARIHRNYTTLPKVS